MASFTILLLVACAALLQVDCKARNHGHGRIRHPNLRNSNDASIALGTVGGPDARNLPVLVINGPDIIIGFPDFCAPDNATLAGTLVVVSNNDKGGHKVKLTADNEDDPQSDLNIACDYEDDGSRCGDGFSVTIYQFC